MTQTKTKPPRLGVDLVHPDDKDKATKEELALFLTGPVYTCIRCAGTGHEYAERGLFRPCKCRVRSDAPDRVRQHLYVVF